MSRKLVVLLVFAFSTLLRGADDPVLGKWKLNPSRSTAEPGPVNRSAALTYEAVPNGEKQSGQAVNAQGGRIASSYTAKYDSKDYPVQGQKDWDSVALTKVDAHTCLLVHKKGSNVVRMTRRAISADGKTMTIASVGVSIQGQVSHNVSVYEKQ